MYLMPQNCAMCLKMIDFYVTYFTTIQKKKREREINVMLEVPSSLFLPGELELLLIAPLPYHIPSDEFAG